MTKCPECADTGSLSKDLYGYLDCVHCEVATERAGLEQWMSKNVPNCDDDSAAWLIYQHGKAAALEKATFRPWQKLWDTQWMNIVNHEHAYSGWSIEDAVHHAVKMTEERLKLNNTEKN